MTPRALFSPKTLNSLTAKGFWQEQKTLTKHNNQHHGELPPPPAARILQLDTIWNKHDAGEWFGEGAVEAIQLIQLIDRYYFTY